jgi:hypothetical protein
MCAFLLGVLVPKANWLFIMLMRCNPFEYTLILLQGYL